MRVLQFILTVSKPYRLFLLGMILSMAIVSIDMNVKPYLIKSFIDVATGVAHWKFSSILMVYIIFQILLVSAWYFYDFCNAKYLSNLRMAIMRSFDEKLSQYSYSFFQNNLAGSLASKVSDAFNTTPQLIIFALEEYTLLFFRVLFALVTLSFVHIYFTIGLFCWVCIFISVTFLLLKHSQRIARDYAEVRPKLYGHLADYFINILNVFFFNTRDYEKKRLEVIGKEFVQKNQRLFFFMMRFFMLQGSIVSVYIVLYLLMLIYLFSEGLITGGDFAIVFMINFGITDAMFQASGGLREFATNWGTVDAALNILEITPEIVDKLDAPSLKIQKGEIIFDNVKFHYKGAEALFQNKSVTIPAGQKVGLVGYSGGGKTTFVNLILRLYDVSEGAVYIDGQNIREVTQESLRGVIGMIPQDPTLFHRTLFENIRYGRIDASEEDVIQAAKRAHAHDFILKLPEGYDSLVGERGVKLSGGQRQRVAIARAILKNAPILILDEATSQLDSVTESEIQASLWDLMQHKTTVVIAHRLSTLLHMDRILVFDKGKIVQEGTHAELVAKKGLYKLLWEAQVGGFLQDEVTT